MTRHGEIGPCLLRGAVAAGIGAAMGAWIGGCDTPPSPPSPAPVRTSAEPLYVPPPPEGCARTGSLEALEADGTCIVAHADDTTMRDAMKHLVFDFMADSQIVTAGGQVVLRLSVTNSASAEVALLLDTLPPSTGARPDWSRLAGVPEPKPAASGMPAPEGYRLVMPIRTLDAHEHGVDGLPFVLGSTSAPGGSTPVPRTLRVRLRPGGKLTQNFTWWALRIPTPGPITRDDAGHRFVPKTAPVPLPSGEYVVDVELPLHGISPPESIVSTRVRVEKADAAP
jgi:hypothetical protein